jgi:hypothetical protein
MRHWRNAIIENWCWKCCRMLPFVVRCRKMGNLGGIFVARLEWARIGYCDWTNSVTTCDPPLFWAGALG